jgi:hypothetical protein
MLQKIFWFGLGFFVAWYVIPNTPANKAKINAEVDKLQNSVHDLIKKYAPDANDQAVASDVISTIPVK